MPGGYAIGIAVDAGILNVSATASQLGLPVPKDVDEMLQSGNSSLVRTVLDRVQQQPDAAVVLSPASVKFAPLVTRPEKIICVGFNYRHHAEETDTPMPKEPPLFSKYHNALNHHGGIISLPTSIDYQFDYETELVIVFSKECKDVSAADALNYVAGYAVGNDFSARRMQTVTTQFTAGKASDGFAPVGPWLVTRDQIKDPNSLQLQTFVNGQRRQDWNTKDMIFGCSELIAYAASIMTIRPGDILFTGTPQGVIFGEKAPPEQRRWLRDGDEVRVPF